MAVLRTGDTERYQVRTPCAMCPTEGQPPRWESNPRPLSQSTHSQPLSHDGGLEDFLTFVANLKGRNKEASSSTSSSSHVIGRPPHPSRPDGQHHRHARNDIVVRKALSRYPCPYVRASHRQHCCISVRIKSIENRWGPRSQRQHRFWI